MPRLKIRRKDIYLHPILRGGAVVARWAHNPKVASSNLVPATLKASYLAGLFLVNKGIEKPPLIVE